MNTEQTPEFKKGGYIGDINFKSPLITVEPELMAEMDKKQDDHIRAIVREEIHNALVNHELIPDPGSPSPAVFENVSISATILPDNGLI